MLVGNTKKLDVVIPTVVPKTGKRLNTKSSQFPDTWKTYKRLVNPNQPVPRLREKYVNKGCLLDIPTVDVPSKQGLKCTCYENVVHAVREMDEGNQESCQRKRTIPAPPGNTNGSMATEKNITWL